jgi:ABC-type Fe3+-citrate transport system substrate-binding protein
MKTIIALLLVVACSSKSANEKKPASTSDWDSGASRSQSYRSEQAQEQVEATDLQFTTPGAAGANQSIPK